MIVAIISISIVMGICVVAVVVGGCKFRCLQTDSPGNKIRRGIAH